MRFLMWYFRSIFRSHEWKYEETIVIEGGKRGNKVSVTCKECGWNRNYWKFM